MATYRRLSTCNNPLDLKATGAEVPVRLLTTQEPVRTQTGRVGPGTSRWMRPSASQALTHLTPTRVSTKKDHSPSFVIISLYVDDLLLFSNDLVALRSFKSVVSSLFKMKDLGEAKFGLGIEIIRNRPQRTNLLITGRLCEGDDSTL